MGVTRKVFKICEKYFKMTDKIAELGAQYICGDEWGEWAPPYFKNVFSGLDITSFDYNGEKNNCVQINLSNPMPEIYHNQFDLVTNFGTTEHVQNQYVCWQNVFNILKKEGTLINEIPKKGKENWPGHSKYYYDEDTFKALSQDFEIIEMKDIFHEGEGDNIYCVMKKIHSDTFRTTEKQLLESIEIVEDFDDYQGF